MFFFEILFWFQINHPAKHLGIFGACYVCQVLKHWGSAYPELDIILQERFRTIGWTTHRQTLPTEHWLNGMMSFSDVSLPHHIHNRHCFPTQKLQRIIVFTIASWLSEELKSSNFPENCIYLSCWWFRPIWKYIVKVYLFPTNQRGGDHQKSLKPPPTVDERNPAPPGMEKKPCTQWGKLPINWYRISSINSMAFNPYVVPNAQMISMISAWHSLKTPKS